MNSEDEYEVFRRRKRLAYITTSVLTVVIVIASFVYFYSSQTVEPIAAIVDQLGSSGLHESSRHVNETFINQAKQLLSSRYRRVDYYSDNATVENYKSLTAYKLIIWRAHSALDLDEQFIAISSSEKNSTASYWQYLQNGYLILWNMTGDPNFYYGITPKFVSELMNGRFQDTVIVLMSCNGLKQNYTKTAEKFVEKGVKAFISWDGWIDRIDNDNAISSLLGFLFNENDTVAEAVGRIRSFVSPIYGPCTLRYFPIEAENYRIPDYNQNNTASSQTSWLVTVSPTNKKSAASVFLKPLRSIGFAENCQSG